jgi:hypothetical protein
MSNIKFERAIDLLRRPDTRMIKQNCSGRTQYFMVPGGPVDELRSVRVGGRRLVPRDGTGGAAQQPPLKNGPSVVSGTRHRRKGVRVERVVVRALQDHGLASQRVPLSGAARGRFGGGVSVPLLGLDRRVEVKARANGFRCLYDWLGDHDFLIVKADRRKPLVILPLDLATEIAVVAERARGQTS